MQLTASQTRLIERVINVFETGKPDGDYSSLVVYADGPHDTRQITYGRSQTTEYGNLRTLVARYVAADGQHSASLKPYAELVGSVPLTYDTEFKRLLVRAGRDDPVMRRVQDEFFNEAYFQPAQRWCEQQGFQTALAMLVVYDSFIHSGRILWAIRGLFPEVTPKEGGDEKAWITAYVASRDNWLRNHRRLVVRDSAYRTEDLMRECSRGNWSLGTVPIKANGVDVV